MTRDIPLQRLAPKTQQASIAAVAGLATFSGCSPYQLSPDQIRTSLHHRLVERHLAWSSWNQVACGRKFFSVTTLGWDALHLNVPPRTGRRLLPHLMSVEALQRLCTSATNPRNRALLMTTSAAGLRVGEVVRLQRTDIESDRMLIRVNQAKAARTAPPSCRLVSSPHCGPTGNSTALQRGSFPAQTPPSPCRSLPPSSSTPTPSAPLVSPMQRHPYPAALLCYASLGSRGGPAHHPTPARSSLHRYHDTLSPPHPAAPGQGHSPFDLLCFGDTPCPQTENVMLAHTTGCPPVAQREDPGRPPWEVADVLRHSGATYRATHHVPPSHHKVSTLAWSVVPLRSGTCRTVSSVRL